ncbi:metalloregulator ArsR/SmtB family transcription factor [Gordonia sp. HNM0687]|uniref:Metalloregulator ArsR/SmtB family transcription factor n=1 Tax=Gordonia mangrovi TaxID=2665643 RepID=A0A6L7GTK2_9ACTN|nr:metalloregulator ArsR/SmtB family transcription factor [Gordonia mangrovi]MDY6810593.1 metalloregulator ArsR/SmtB family transcription factor [Actinomycetota bacterium]MXP21838.1 metalloregulator ArsR/SmtB family transcription factor [Gordonia mangrovi]UVF76209.1 metalloregulator ArsR/SmtB family transcription factor [Gordonia mangrovi]
MTDETAMSRDTRSLHHPVEPDPALLAAATSVFAMLAEPTRLHLVSLLADGEADVSSLTEATGASRTAVSQHLAKLRFTGLVDTRKEGRRVIYRIRDGHLRRLIAEALNFADHQVTGEPTHS